MKSILAIGFALLIVAIFIVFFGFGSGERPKDEEPWGSPDGLINGTWGTSIEVEYEDGSTDILNQARPLLDITFGEQKVKNFKYTLSVKVTSDTYSAVEIDMLNFEVLSTVYEEEGQWGREVTSNDTVNIDTDGEWNEIYRIQVDANELEILAVNRTYNLSFTPSGTINYRGASTGDWISVPLPSWFYVNFKVKTDDTGEPPGGEPPNGDPWIEVVFGSGIEDYYDS